MDEQIKNLEMRIGNQIKNMEKDLDDVSSTVKQHIKEHGKEHKELDKNIAETNQTIKVIENVVTGLEGAIKDLTAATGSLREQMIEQSIYNKQNTDFRSKFTWKEILASLVGIGALINVVAHFW